jgi:lipopolysaccharide heptosyltransferase I
LTPFLRPWYLPWESRQHRVVCEYPSVSPPTRLPKPTMKSTSSQAYPRILVVRLSAVGDVINALPVLVALRARFPRAWLGWLVEDKARAVVEHHTCVDQTFVFDRKRLTAAIGRGRPGETCRSIKSLRTRLRQARFEVTLDLHGNMKSALLGGLAGSRIRIGYDRRNSREGNHLLNNVHVSLPVQRIHRVEKHLRLLTALGIHTTDPGPFLLPVPESAQSFASQYLQSIDAPGRPLVIFHPGTSVSGAFKRWPLDSYARLAEALVQRIQAKVVISHGSGEHELVAAIADRCTCPVELPETRTLGQLAALIQRASLFVSADTGPMHIAAALNVPVVALFGPKDPVVYGPYRTRSIVLQARLCCQPCGRRRCKDPICMRLISPEEAFHACLDLLRTSGTPMGDPRTPVETCG